jgi:hypothetical protein
MAALSTACSAPESAVRMHPTMSFSSAPGSAVLVSSADAAATANIASCAQRSVFTAPRPLDFFSRVTSV